MSRVQTYWKEFKEKKSRLVDLAAETKGRKVCLVDSDWHKSLIKWINEKSLTPPANINNKGLLINGGLNMRLQYKIDFEVVEEDVWPLIEQAFGKTNKIEKFYVLDPETRKPHVILDPVNIKINIENFKEIKKMCDKKWKIGPIITQLCQAINLDSQSYKLMTPDSANEIISDTKVSEIIEKYPGTLQLIRCNRNNITIEIPARENQIKTQEILPQHVNIYEAGFKNLGNTCYFNAAVQCLIRIKKLTDYVLSPSFNDSLNIFNRKGSGGKVATAFKNTLTVLAGSKSGVFSPSQLRESLCSKFRKYANYDEHDAAEAMLDILDMLHEDTNRNSACTAPEGEEDPWKIHVAKNASFIVDTFHGELQSTIVCSECGNAVEKGEPFIFLQLPIKSSFFSKVNLEDSIREFGSQDFLSGDNKWQCPHCKKGVDAAKTTRVRRCPPVLLLQMKRFEAAGGAVMTSLLFPDDLDMRKYVSGEKGGVYKLIGVVYYHKNMLLEHYTCAALSQLTNKWHIFDDESVKEVEQSAVHQGNAYILIYQRRA